MKPFFLEVNLEGSYFPHVTGGSSQVGCSVFSCNGPGLLAAYGVCGVCSCWEEREGVVRNK